jgi:hypothetical protein
MSETLLEKHESVVVDMANAYLDNLEVELGKKYKNSGYEIVTGLTDEQYTEIRTKHNIPSGEFSELYTEFQRMKPTDHLRRVMSAFTASGGSVDVEPAYDEDTQRLKLSVNFIIDDKTLDNIEGLSPIEDLLLKRDAMFQIDTVLSGSDPDVSPSF